MKLKKISCSLVCVLGLISGGAGHGLGDCALSLDEAGRQVLRNETLRLVIDPANGGKGVALTDLRSGTELTTGIGLFEDRFWPFGNMMDLAAQKYEVDEVLDSPEEVRVRMKARPREVGFTDLELFKTIGLRSGSHSIAVAVEFRNGGEHALPVGLWVMNSLGDAEAANRFYAPARAGVSVMRFAPESDDENARWKASSDEAVAGSRFLYTFVRGWQGAVSDRGFGAAVVFDPAQVSCVYNWTGATGSAFTIEMIYNSFRVEAGGSWSASYSVLPFGGMERIDGAGGGAVGAIAGISADKAGEPGKVRLALHSAENRTARVAFALLSQTGEGSEVVYTEERDMGLEASGTATAEFDFTPARAGRYLLRFAVMGESGETLFDMERQIGVETTPGRHERVANFEPRGATMTRFQDYDGTENLANSAPRGLRGYATYEMTSDVETPHVKWTKPYSKGVTRVLITENVQSIRDAVELDQRMDIEYDCVYHHPSAGGGTHEKYKRVPRMSAFELSRWEAKLDKDNDAIVIGAVPAPYFPDEIRDEILRKVEQGTGLVVVKGESYRGDWVDDLERGSVDVSDEFTGAVPFSLMENLHSKGLVKRASLGKGHVYILSFASGSVWMRGGASLIPSHKKSDSYWEGMPLDEWRYAFVSRVILAAGGKALAGDLSLASIPETLSVSEAANGAFELELGTAADKAEKVFFHLTDRFGGVLWERKVKVTGGGSVPVPGVGVLGHGSHVLAARVFDAEGRALDWTMRAFEVESPLALADLRLEKAYYNPGDEIRGSVKLAGDPVGAGKVELRLEIEEFGGRLIESRSLPVEVSTGEEMFFALPFENPLWRSAFARATLVVGGRDAHELRADFVCDSVEKEDFYFLSYTSFSAEREIELGFNGIYQGYTDMRRERQNLPVFIWREDSPNMYIEQSVFGNSSGPVRDPCLTDPAFLEKTAELMHEIRTKRFQDKNVLGLVTVDEWKYGGRNVTRPNLCSSPTCLAGLRAFALERYGSLEAINRVWGTDYKSVEEIGPVSPAETDRRLGLVRAGGKARFADWLDHKLYVERMMADFVGYWQECLGREAPMGVSGTQRTDMQAFVGWDLWQIFGRDKMPAVNLYSGAQLEIARSFAKPHHFITQWGGGYDINDVNERSARMSPWQALVQGRSGISYYITPYSPVTFPDHTFRRQAQWIRETIQTIRKDGFARLIRQAERARDGVAIYYSAASLHGQRLANLLDGSAPFTGPNYDSLVSILKDCGIMFDFVSYEEAERGKLAEYGLVLMPFIHYLGERESAAIRSYAEAGGVVVADIISPLMVEMLGGAPLLPLFGVEVEGLAEYAPAALSKPAPDISMPRGSGAVAPAGAVARYAFEDGAPAFLVNKVGAGKAVYLNFSFHDYSQTQLGGVGGEEETVLLAGIEKRLSSQALMNVLLEEAGISRDARVSLADTKQNYGGEITRFRDGEAEYVVILRSEGASADVHNSLTGNLITEADKHRVFVEFARKAHVYDSLAGGYLGETDSFETVVTDSKPVVFALLPRKIEGASLEVADSISAGEVLSARARIAGADAGAAVLRAYDPAGVERYRRVLSYKDGRVAGEIPFALNDPLGSWRLKLTDVASGTEAEAAVLLGAPR